VSEGTIKTLIESGCREALSAQPKGQATSLSDHRRVAAGDVHARCRKAGIAVLEIYEGGYHEGGQQTDETRHS
jgi:hypothetical protein